MRVILLDDVERVGHEGDILNVADGYARNYLLPRRLAVRATKGALRDLERRGRAIAQREAARRAKAQALAQELATQRITVYARAGQGQRLHGQVTPQMIAEAVKQQLKMDIDRRDIDIPEPIRELGDYLISVKLYKDVAAQLPVCVVRQGEEEPAAPRAGSEEPAQAITAEAETVEPEPQSA